MVSRSPLSWILLGTGGEDFRSRDEDLLSKDFPLGPGLSLGEES